MTTASASPPITGHCCANWYTQSAQQSSELEELTWDRDVPLPAPCVNYLGKVLATEQLGFKLNELLYAQYTQI